MNMPKFTAETSLYTSNVGLSIIFCRPWVLTRCTEIDGAGAWWRREHAQKTDDKEITMTLPSFTAEAAVYSARGLYRASGSVEAGPHVAYTAQQLATVDFKAGVLKKMVYLIPARRDAMISQMALADTSGSATIPANRRFTLFCGIGARC